MLIRMVKAELKYIYYEMISVSRTNIIFIGLFLSLFAYCSFNGKSLAQYTSAESYFIIQSTSIYILLRMVLSGISLPNNVFDAELRSGRCFGNNGIVDAKMTTKYSIRILIKAFFASILNIVTMFFIMYSLNLVVEIKNYILITILIMIGTLYLLSIGFIINTIMRAFYLKRELIIAFEILFLILYFLMNEDSHLFPITILMTQLSGVLSNDILYSKFLLNEIIGYALLWIAMIFFSIIIVYLSNCVTSILLTRDSYGRKNEK
ncbi:MAG: hypothetical protein GX236_11000 [Clostridiaceae bacterium]|nr:hypothetical protein [Clostridiaceae bacterium]